MNITNIKILYNDWSMNTVGGSIDVMSGRKSLYSDWLQDEKDIVPALKEGIVTKDTKITLTNSKVTLNTTVKDMDSKDFKQKIKAFVKKVNDTADHDLSKFFFRGVDLIRKKANEKKEVVDLTPKPKPKPKKLSRA